MFKSLLIASIFALGIHSAHSMVVYDNGFPDTAGGHEATAWIHADDFKLTNSATINRAKVYLFSTDTQALVDSWDGTLSYSLYGDHDFDYPSLGTEPGALMSSGKGSNFVIADTGMRVGGFGQGYWIYSVEFDLAADFLGQAGERYWFGIHLSDDFERDNLYWATSRIGYSTYLQSDSNDWYLGLNDFAFSLSGSTANQVPEPGSLALVAIGMAGLLARRRK